MDASIVATAAGELVTDLAPVALAGVGVMIAILGVKRGASLIKSLAK